MPFWGVVMGVVNIIMGVARGRYHQLPVGVAMVPEGSLKKLEPMHFIDNFDSSNVCTFHFLCPCFRCSAVPSSVSHT